MQKFDALIIGTATCDTFLKGFKYEIVNSNVFTNGKALAISYGEKEKVETLGYHVGGGGVNIAIALANFSVKNAVIIRIAKDYSGNFVFKKIREKKNIFTKFIQYDRKEETSSACVLVTQEGERTVLSYKGCSKNLVVDKKILDKIETGVLVSSTMSGNINNFNTIFEYKKRHPETLLVANPGSADLSLLKNNIDWLQNYDVFVLNQEEASFLTGIDFKKEREIFTWLDQQVKGIYIMTRGADGLVFSDGKDVYSAKLSVDVLVEDSTGAGDAFVAGFILGYHKTRDVFSGVRFGLANATQVIEKIGAHTGVLKPEDLKQERWKNNFEIIHINKLS